MSEHLTNHGSPSPDLHALAQKAAVEAGFVIELPADAQAELAELLRSPPDMSDALLRDLRDLPWLSIDNPESRDLDQISTAEARPDGTVRVLVGLADVDAWVRQGSALDLYAATNTSSVYAGVEVFHMLPEQLSTGLSSLNEGEDRLAVVVEMQVTAEGEIAAADIYRALARNQRRFDYEAVGAWLDDETAELSQLKEDPAMADQLRLQDRAMQALRARHQEEGALDLETIEARPVVEAGRVVDLLVVRKNRARALVEQMMVSANGVVAGFLQARGSPAIARAHEPPHRWERMREVAAEYGAELPREPDARALAAFLARRRAADPGRYPDLSLTVAKLLGGSDYRAVAPGADDPGHFGLAVEDYTHATAPNRRYPDLLTQRLLKAAIAGRPAPYSMGELAAIAARCTERTGAANKVERQMRKAAAAMLLRGREGEIFDGIVTGITQRGVFARLLQPPAEGRVVRGEEGLDVGDYVRLRLAATDVERGFIDFERVEGSSNTSEIAPSTNTTRINE